MEKNGLLKTTATVQALLRSRPRSRIRLQIKSESEPAEDRKTFRICVAASPIQVKVGSVEKCWLMDTSAEGFGLIAGAEFKAGQVVETVLNYAGRRYTGKAVVRSAQKLDDGRYRLGFQVLDTELDLKNGLQQISMAVQREQIRRMRRGS